MLEEKIREYSFSKLRHYKNLEVNFLGEISNDKVREFYISNKVDIFINVSAAEGTPVSIMEAMSMGIPAMGPNIGGISELITDQSGYLLPENPTIQEIAEGLERMVVLSKDKNIRINAKRLIGARFSAEKNYKTFIHEITSLN
jgi:glycosyltransferase involved in cell wall biosynthesis